MPDPSVELLTISELALSTPVAVTAVSIRHVAGGCDRPVGEADRGSLAIAVLIAVLFSGMGGLAKPMARVPRSGARPPSRSG